MSTDNDNEEATTLALRAAFYAGVGSTEEEMDVNIVVRLFKPPPPIPPPFSLPFPQAHPPSSFLCYRFSSNSKKVNISSYSPSFSSPQY